MKRSGSDTRTNILSAAYGLFYQEGFSRVSMDEIAAATGVTKRTLYYHFESKDALAGAVLDRQQRYAIALIQKWGDPSLKSCPEYLTTLFDQLQVWVSEPEWLGSGFTRLTMELADLPGHPARLAAQEHKTSVEKWLSKELENMGAIDPTELARQVMLLIEGCLALTLIHGDASYVSAASEAASRLAMYKTP